MSDAVRLIRPAGLAGSVPYSYGAVVPSGSRLVFLAGACPLDGDARTVAVGDVLGQAAACLENLRVALAASDARLEDVVFVRALAASDVRQELAAVWDLVRSAFGEHEPPGTLQGVTLLGWPDQLVEVEAVAAVPEGRP